MMSLRDLLRTHRSLLLIDSASARIQVGLLRDDATPVWSHSSEEAGVAIFSGTADVLQHGRISLDAVGAFAFCDGPGSVLGIRTAAVALRTWNVLKARPVFAYCSLDLVARFQKHSGAAGAGLSVVADARRNTWHRVTVDATGAVGPLQRVDPAQLMGPLVTPQHFRHWAVPPAGLQTVSYDLPELLDALPTEPLFRDAPEPDAFLHEEPVYQTWTPQVHRAPSPSS